MKTQSFKTESPLWVNFKRSMYAFMVILIALAIPLLSYLELSYRNKTNNQTSKDTKVQNMASVATKQNTGKL